MDTKTKCDSDTSIIEVHKDFTNPDEEDTTQNGKGDIEEAPTENSETSNDKGSITNIGNGTASDVRNDNPSHVGMTDTTNCNLKSVKEENYTREDETERIDIDETTADGNNNKSDEVKDNATKLNTEKNNGIGVQSFTTIDEQKECTTNFGAEETENEKDKNDDNETLDSHNDKANTLTMEAVSAEEKKPTNWFKNDTINKTVTLRQPSIHQRIPNDTVSALDKKENTDNIDQNMEANSVKNTTNDVETDKKVDVEKNDALGCGTTDEPCGDSDNTTSKRNNDETNDKNDNETGEADVIRADAATHGSEDAATNGTNGIGKHNEEDSYETDDVKNTTNDVEIDKTVNVEKNDATGCVTKDETCDDSDNTTNKRIIDATNDKNDNEIVEVDVTRADAVTHDTEDAATNGTNGIGKHNEEGSNETFNGKDKAVANNGEEKSKADDKKDEINYVTNEDDEATNNQEEKISVKKSAKKDTLFSHLKGKLFRNNKVHVEDDKEGVTDMDTIDDEHNNTTDDRKVDIKVEIEKATNVGNDGDTNVGKENKSIFNATESGAVQSTIKGNDTTDKRSDNEYKDGNAGNVTNVGDKDSTNDKKDGPSMLKKKEQATQFRKEEDKINESDQHKETKEGGNVVQGFISRIPKPKMPKMPKLFRKNEKDSVSDQPNEINVTKLRNQGTAHDEICQTETQDLRDQTLQEKKANAMVLNDMNASLKRRDEENKAHLLIIQEKDADIIRLKAELDSFRAHVHSLQEEKAELVLRLSKFASAKLTQNNPNIADLSDTNRPTKLAEMFSELYDNEYTDGLEELCEEQGIEEHVCREKMLDLLQATNNECVQLSEKHKDALRCLTTFTFPLEECPIQEEMSTSRDTRDDAPSTDPSNILKDTGEVDITVELTAEVTKSLADARKMVASKFEENSSLSKIIASKIAHQNNIDPKMQTKLMTYITKCAQLCWYTTIQDPPVVVGFQKVIEDEPFNKDVYKPYMAVGPLLDFIVWPPLFLHKDGPLLCKGVAQGKK